MLSFSSIFILFSEVAVASIGVLAVLGFIQRIKRYQAHRFFYIIAIVGFVMGGLSFAISAFFSTILYFLSSPDVASYIFKYVFFAAPIALWCQWFVLVYVFRRTKVKGGTVVIPGVILGLSSVFFLTIPISLSNTNGIIVPRNAGWQGIFFSIESLFACVMMLYFLVRYKLT